MSNVASLLTFLFLSFSSLAVPFLCFFSSPFLFSFCPPPESGVSDLGSGVWGLRSDLGFGVWGLGVWGSGGLGVWGSEVWGLRSAVVWGLGSAGLRSRGLGSGVWGLGSEI